MLERIVTILYLSGEPITISAVAQLLSAEVSQVEESLKSVETKVHELGLRLLRNGDAVSIVTDAAQAGLVEAFWKEEFKGDLTPATLQVLTIIAYLGNPTRQTISFIRGVQSSQSIRTLAVRGLIKREGEVCSLTGDALRQLGVADISLLPEYKTIRTEFEEKIKTLQL